LTGLIDSIERLHDVVDELITVSRIASGRVDLKLGPTHLNEVLEHVFAGYRQVLDQRKLALTSSARNWPASFYADTALLELAFSNILSNAIKYTPDGGKIMVDVKATVDKRVVVSVKDTGIGPDPKDQQLIFDRFYTAGDTQLHSTSKTAFRGGGLGLGLAIARGIVEAHGGRIWVESPGFNEHQLPGCTFFVELPLEANLPDLARRTFL
jgi:signal transduction histidine kinase